jgi:hypothetical protein
MVKFFNKIKIKVKRRYLLGSASVVAIGLATSAVVLAAIPDTSGVFHGCYKTNGGSLRVIDDASQTCATNETAITWNQTGPQGPVGPTGPQGPAGANGAVPASSYVTSGTNETKEVISVPGLIQVLGSCTYNENGYLIRSLKVKNISTESVKSIYGGLGSLSNLGPDTETNFTDDYVNPLTFRTDSGRTAVINLGMNYTWNSDNSVLTGCQFMAHVITSN